MIRKPDAKVFKDSSTVKAVRGSRVVAREAGKSAGRLWLGFLIFGFILVCLDAMDSVSDHPLLMLVPAAMIGGAIWLLCWVYRGPTRKQAIERTDEYGLPVAPAARADSGVSEQ